MHGGAKPYKLLLKVDSPNSSTIYVMFGMVMHGSANPCRLLLKADSPNSWTIQLLYRMFMHGGAKPYRVSSVQSLGIYRQSMECLCLEGQTI